MHPAFSVIFLTTLIGVGQGLFLALFSAQAYGMAKLLPAQSGSFFANGSFLALLFLLGGLFAAVFHLGKPSYMFTRAWRGMTQWRTSWLSRELIAMPAMMGLTFLYAVFHWFGWEVDLFGWHVSGQLSLAVGIFGVLGAIALFVCTAMIYAAVKFPAGMVQPAHRGQLLRPRHRLRLHLRHRLRPPTRASSRSWCTSSAAGPLR